MDAPVQFKLRAMKLLASTRSLWKQVRASGIDVGAGTVDDVAQFARACEVLSDEVHSIDRDYRVFKAEAL